MNQQLPFYGIHNLQVFDNSVVVGRLQLRYRLGMRHYITLTGNYAKQSESFFEIPDVVAGEYPDLYDLLRRYYRQDPLARLTKATSASSTAAS